MHFPRGMKPFFAVLLCLSLGCRGGLNLGTDAGVVLPGLGGGSGGGGSGGGGGGLTLPMTPPPIDLGLLTLLSTNAESRFLAETQNARLEIDPTTRDAITALGECADAISYCYAPGVTTLKSCFTVTRSCTTQMPWQEAPCCPKACAEAFDARVKAGDSETAAFERVLFLEPDCFPGVRAILEAP